MGLAVNFYSLADFVFHWFAIFIKIFEVTFSPLIIDAEVDERGRRSVEYLCSNQVVRSAVYRCETESTNTLALSELQLATPETNSTPRLFLADRQTAGRGRRGREWNSDSGTLTFSLVISREEYDSAEKVARFCSLAVGVGISRYLEFEFSPFNTRLKWPNDVYAAGGKLAGILIEIPAARPEYLVVGVGLNVETVPEISDRRGCVGVSGLSHALGRRIERFDLLAGLVGSILEVISEADRDETQLLMDFRQRCLLTGQQIEFQTNEGQASGVCLGLNESGKLRVLGASGEVEIESGEANLIRTVG